MTCGWAVPGRFSSLPQAFPVSGPCIRLAPPLRTLSPRAAVPAGPPVLRWARCIDAGKSTPAARPRPRLLRQVKDRKTASARPVESRKIIRRAAHPGRARVRRVSGRLSPAIPVPTVAIVTRPARAGEPEPTSPMGHNRGQLRRPLSAAYACRAAPGVRPARLSRPHPRRREDPHPIIMSPCAAIALGPR